MGKGYVKGTHHIHAQYYEVKNIDTFLNPFDN